jgi:hypothetical protein
LASFSFFVLGEFVGVCFQFRQHFPHTHRCVVSFFFFLSLPGVTFVLWPPDPIVIPDFSIIECFFMYKSRARTSFALLTGWKNKKTAALVCSRHAPFRIRISPDPS